MLEFENEEKVIELIKKSCIDNTEEDAQRLIYKLKNSHEELHPYIKAWVNGEEPDFEYHGITIKEIMKTQCYNYFLALYEMNTVINNPNPEERIEHIRNRFMDTVGSTKKKG